MPFAERIFSLKTRHAELESELKAEARRPQPDAASVARIKREKLRLKDEIERLAHRGQAAGPR